MRLKRIFAVCVKHAERYLRNSPRARRLVLRVLARSPWLSIKLRRAYLGSALLGIQPQQMQALPSPVGSNLGVLTGPPLASGINAGQRTPLEKHFHCYVEPE